MDIPKFLKATPQYGITETGRRRHIVRHEGIEVSLCSQLLWHVGDVPDFPVCKVCEAVASA